MISYGPRIKFYKVADNIFVSHKVFSNGVKSVQVVVDKNEMTFRFIDPVTKQPTYQFQKKINNYEVLQRHIKKDLIRLLGVSFSKENRQVSSDE